MKKTIRKLASTNQLPVTPSRVQEGVLVIRKLLTMRAISCMVKRSLCLFLVFVMIFSMSAGITAFAAGSAQLNVNDDGYRFYTEYLNRESAGLMRKTILKCYLMKGETAYFGSSVYDSRMNIDGTDVVKNSSGAEIESGNDIVVTLPDGTKVPYDVIQNGAGYIVDYQQENNGPKVFDGDETDTTKYEPLSFVAPVEGVYTFDFHSQRGLYTGLQQSTQKLVKDPQDQKNFTVAHWDVTVKGTDDEIKSGRLWTTLLAITSSAAQNIKANLETFVLTNDGYIYDVKFKDIIPYGFTFFANNQGFTTTGQTPYSIYHSFYDNDNALGNIETEEFVTIHKPDAPDTEFAQSFKIFFEMPNEDLIGKVYNEPVPVEKISEITFHGGQTQGVTNFRQGGYFTFVSKGATTATITIDFRESLKEIEAETIAAGKTWNYNGSGIVELSGAVVDGENTFYWDGKDTSGVAIPVGVYGKNDIKTVSEAKGGEVHFPFIDVEGLCGGVEIERVNGDWLGTADKYDIYYNNNPLAYNTIEYDTINKQPVNVTMSGTSAILSDGTKSIGNGRTSQSATSGDTKYGGMYFEQLSQADNKTIEYKNISTLYRDTPEYLYNVENGAGAWNALSQAEKDAYTAECANYEPTYHHEPNDSRYDTIIFDNPATDNISGGGNQAGIDIWTYYSSGANSDTSVKTDILIMESEDTGKLSGRIFYDEEPNRAYDFNKIDYPLKGIEVELVDEKGVPISDIKRLPLFDDNGYFLRDENNQIIFEEQTVYYRTTTNKYGVYTFTGVPVSPEGKTYYAHVLLTQEQAIALGYRLTTTSITTPTNGTTGVGPDGNKRGSNISVKRTDASGTISIGGLVSFNDDKQTIFDKSKAQSVTIYSDNINTPAAENVGEFRDIGYHTQITIEDQMNYQINKVWPDDGTTKLPDVTMMLYVWDAGGTADAGNDNGNGVHQRTGNLIDTVKLSASNNWSYTWHHLDKNLQYYVIEYYTKTNDAGQIMYNDRGDERLVLIGGTMPVASSAPKANESKSYPFVLEGETKARNIEYFGDELTHKDATTETEKSTTIDNDALLYNFTYVLTVDAVAKTNIMYITNSQTYDEREYYVWLDHKTVLPGFVSTTLGTHVDPVTGEKIRENETLSPDANGNIAGMTVTSIDAPVNTYGDANTAFFYNPDDPTSVLFTATNHGNYPEGTGTRTYKVTYDHPNDDDDAVYTWTLTIHVYDVNEDYYVLDYGLKAKLQESEADKDTTENFKYMMLSNDVLRVELYKNAVHPIMNTCTDFVGVSYSPDGVIPDSEVGKLEWADTLSRDGGKDAYAKATGKNGTLEVNLEKSRLTTIPKGHDHAEFAEAVFTPTNFMSDIDVFYYKIVVFGESYTYKYPDYDDIDATSGVVMYAPVYVMPANSVYYEDGYRFSTEYSKKDFDVETNPNAVITADNGFQSIDREENYGHDNAYIDPAGAVAGQYDSLGASTNVAARSSSFNFDFTGTGFEIIGRTDSTAAKLTYRVEKKDSTGAYKLYAGSTVDASYIDTNDAALYQLPVISVKNLPYGDYRVKTGLILTSTGNYHFNLDGIRIYDPLGENGSDFYIENEIGAKVASVRELVLGSFSEDQVADGYIPSDAKAAIIYSSNSDGTYNPGSTVTEVRTSSSLVNHSEDLDDYLSSGPKCELYIPSGSGIAFAVDADSTPEDNTLQLEIKAIYDGDEGAGIEAGYGRLNNVGSDQIIEVNSSTSMYYNLDTTHLDKNNVLILVNDSDYTVSVSNLKYKGYTISYPENFTKADVLASTTLPDEGWRDNKTDFGANVTVSAANFTTSYARAGRYVDLNVTVMEPETVNYLGERAKYMPVVYDENGNVVTLSETDIIPVRSFKTYLPTVGEETVSYTKTFGFVYKIRLMVPYDVDYLAYTVGAMTRSEVTVADGESTKLAYLYSENGMYVGIMVKPSDIMANVTVTSLASPAGARMMRAMLLCDEPVNTEDENWSQDGENSVYADFTEEGEYSVVLTDIDGYECTVFFTVQMPDDPDTPDDPDVPDTPDEPEKIEGKSVIEKIVAFFKRISNFILRLFRK